MVEFKSLRPPNMAEDYDGAANDGEPIVELHEREDGIRLDFTFPGFMLSGVDPDVDVRQVQAMTHPSVIPRRTQPLPRKGGAHPGQPVPVDTQIRSR